MIGALCCVGLSIAGCDKTSDGFDVDGFQMAVVMTGATADAGRNDGVKKAAERLEHELQLAEPVSVYENTTASQAESVLREYARGGCDLVICHGYEWHQPVREVAPDFPDTMFVISGYDQPSPHFGGIVYQLGEAAYLCGAMAAHVSQTGCAGFIAAQRVPPVERCYRGFRNGLLQHRPQAAVREPVYVGGPNPWDDSAAAKVKTQALLASDEPCRIDVLFQYADAAGRGIFEAVEQHTAAHPEQPVFVFGSNRDQNGTTASPRVLASAVIHVDKAFLRVAREVRAGTYTPHVQSETVATGAIDCIIHPELEAMVGPERAAACREVVEQARRALKAGAIDAY